MKLLDSCELESNCITNKFFFKSEQLIRVWRLYGVKSKADDPAESRRSWGQKQTIFWAKADDLIKADNPKKNFFLLKADDHIYFFVFQSRRS